MKKNLTFEEAITRLEEITKILEEGTRPLEESLKLYEEGAALSVFCDKKLKEAEQKIEILSTEGN